jgi:hypothetical protein
MRGTLVRLFDDTRFSVGLQHQRKLKLTVVRIGGVRATELILGETDQLQPGDVLKVGLELSSLANGSSSNLTQGSSVAPPLAPQTSNVPRIETR